jgi:hypothetical protein
MSEGSSGRSRKFDERSRRRRAQACHPAPGLKEAPTEAALLFAQPLPPSLLSVFSQFDPVGGKVGAKPPYQALSCYQALSWR